MCILSLNIGWDDGKALWITSYSVSEKVALSPPHTRTCCIFSQSKFHGFLIFFPQDFHAWLRKSERRAVPLHRAAFSQGSLQLSQAMTSTEGRIQCLGVRGHCESPQLNLHSVPLALESSIKRGQEIGFPDPSSLPWKLSRRPGLICVRVGFC